MIRHLTRQFGLVFLGLCVLAAGLPIADDLQRVHESMHDADMMVRDAATQQCTINKLAGDINASQLQPPAQYVTFLPKRKPVQIARQ